MTVSMYQQNPDGTWSEATPIPPSRTLRLERWLARHGMHGLARMIARFDERGLGR
jgi:hypothetical protein